MAFVNVTLNCTSTPLIAPPAPPQKGVRAGRGGKHGVTTFATDLLAVMFELTTVVENVRPPPGPEVRPVLSNSTSAGEFPRLGTWIARTVFESFGKIL